LSDLEDNSPRRHPQTLLAEALDFTASRGKSEHAHQANEFLLCVAGEGRHVTSLVSFDFTPGSLAFFARGQVHAHAAVSPACRAISVRFRDAALVAQSEVDGQAAARLRFLKRRAFLGANALPLGDDTRAEIEMLFARAVREDAERASGYKCVLKGIALQAIVLVARDPVVGFQAGRGAAGRGIMRVPETLDQDPAQEVSVERMAALACMSRSHFHAAFRRIAGVPLLDHVARLRWGVACRQLLDTDDPILEICERSGFASMSRFYQVFERFSGMPPGEVRRSGAGRRGS